MNSIQKYLTMRSCKKFAIENNVGGYNNLPTENKQEILEALYTTFRMQSDDSYTRKYLDWYNGVYESWISNKGIFLSKIKITDPKHYLYWINIDNDDSPRDENDWMCDALDIISVIEKHGYADDSIAEGAQVPVIGKRNRDSVDKLMKML